MLESAGNGYQRAIKTLLASPVSCGSCLRLLVMAKRNVTLELPNGDSSVLALVGFSLQALHQVVAEDAVFQVWNGQAAAYSSH